MSWVTRWAKSNPRQPRSPSFGRVFCCTPATPTHRNSHESPQGDPRNQGRVVCPRRNPVAMGAGRRGCQIHRLPSLQRRGATHVRDFFQAPKGRKQGPFCDSEKEIQKRCCTRGTGCGRVTASKVRQTEPAEPGRKKETNEKVHRDQQARNDPVQHRDICIRCPQGEQASQASWA